MLWYYALYLLNHVCTHIESNQLLCPGKFCKHYAYLSLIFYLPFNSCSVYRLRWVISIHLSSLINSQNYQWSVNQSNYLLHEDAITVRNDYRCSNLVYNGLLLMSLPLCYFARGFISPFLSKSYARLYLVFFLLSGFLCSCSWFHPAMRLFFSLSLSLFLSFSVFFFYGHGRAHFLGKWVRGQVWTRVTRRIFQIRRKRTNHFPPREDNYPARPAHSAIPSPTQSRPAAPCWSRSWKTCDVL